MARWFALLLVAGLAGCASRAPAPVAESQGAARIEAPRTTPPAQPVIPAGKFYLVKKGDTLSGIAREHGLNARDIAAWNNLDNGNRIGVGQQLRLTPPAAPTAQPAATSAADGTEVRPIASSGAVTARPLDGAAAAPAPTPAAGAVPPAPTPQSLAPGNTETLKRGPKGGKLPYSEENLARLKGMEPAPAQPAVAPAPEKTAAAQAPAAPPAPAAPTGNDWGWPAGGKLLANFSDGGAGAQGLNRGIDIAGSIGDPVLAAAPGKVIFVGVYPKHGNLVVLLHADGYSTVYAHNQRVLVKEGQAVKRGQKIAELGNSDADQPKLHFELRQQGKPLDPLKYLPAR